MQQNFFKEIKNNALHLVKYVLFHETGVRGGVHVRSYATEEYFLLWAALKRCETTDEERVVWPSLRRTHLHKLQHLRLSTSEMQGAGGPPALAPWALAESLQSMCLGLCLLGSRSPGTFILGHS